MMFAKPRGRWIATSRRASGMGIREALLETSPVRMRPALMTSLTIILAMLPAAMQTSDASGMGAGAYFASSKATKN